MIKLQLLCLILMFELKIFLLVLVTGAILTTISLVVAIVIFDAKIFGIGASTGSRGKGSTSSSTDPTSSPTGTTSKATSPPVEVTTSSPTVTTLGPITTAPPPTTLDPPVSFPSTRFDTHGSCFPQFTGIRPIGFGCNSLGSGCNTDTFIQNKSTIGGWVIVASPDEQRAFVSIKDRNVLGELADAIYSDIQRVSPGISNVFITVSLNVAPYYDVRAYELMGVDSSSSSVSNYTSINATFWPKAAGINPLLCPLTQEQADQIVLSS